jgi:hypothetical protein
MNLWIEDNRGAFGLDRICLASDFKLNFWRQDAFFIMSLLFENLNRIFIFTKTTGNYRFSTV